MIPFFLLLPGLTGSSQISFQADPVPPIGCDSLEVTFTFANPTAIPIAELKWDFGNGDTASGTGPHVIMYDTTGSFTVTVTVDGTTTLTRSDYVRIYPSPRAWFWWSDSLELGSYTVAMINAGQTVDSLNYSYQWFIQGNPAGNTRGIIYTFPDAGEYQAGLIVTNEFGCADTSVRRITVIDTLDCPNVFTPNEDGRNDYFVVNSNGLNVYIIEIYSQSGMLVYRAEAPLLIWDGRNLSGQKLLPGIYFYVIRAADGNSPFEKKGFVQLYR